MDYTRNEQQEVGPGKSVFAIFRTHQEVVSAVKALEEMGFEQNQISVLHASPNATRSKSHDLLLATEIREGAVFGAIIGAVCGISLGFLFDPASFSSMLPLAVPFSLPGASASEALTMNAFVLTMLLGLLGALLGAGSGALVGIGVPEPLAKRYARYLNEGGILISVRADDVETERRVLSFYDKNGAAEPVSASEAETIHGISCYWNSGTLRPVAVHTYRDHHNFDYSHPS